MRSNSCIGLRQIRFRHQVSIIKGTMLNSALFIIENCLQLLSFLRDY